MASAYPGALDTLATNKTNTTVQNNDHPNHHNDMADAINKIEAELGAAPSGPDHTTVVARFNGSVKGFVNHGSNASTARPSGYASVEWLGSVTPTNAINGDTWINTT